MDVWCTYSNTDSSNQIRERTNLAIDIRFGLIRARCLSDLLRLLFGESTVLPPLFAIAGFGARKETPTNHFEDRISEDAAYCPFGWSNIWMWSSSTQLKSQFVIVAQLHTIADDQQVAVESSVIGRQPAS